MISIRKTLVAVAGIAAMGMVSLASAGSLGSFGEAARGGGSSGGSESSSPSYSPAPSYTPPPSAPSAPSVQRVREAAPARSSDTAREVRQSVERQVGPRSSSRESDPRAARNQETRPAAGNRDNADAGSNSEKRRSGVIGSAIARNYPRDNGGNGNGNGNPHDDHDHNGHPQRPPRVVYVLPPYYSDYYWNNSWYYNFDGGWYSPYGNGYMSVGAPYGMYMRTLPGYSNSFYYGDVRYYRHDNTYYTYDRSRGGYVVARSPYGDDEEESVVDEDLYIYPAKSQSEQQQADDRYECHRWGVKESGYDPIDDAYDRDRRASYVRAMTACLTGKGYTVK